MSQTPDELGKKIQEAREKSGLVDKASGEHTNPEDKLAVGKAMRTATDLVAALAVGGFLGYWIDQWIGTKPWGMVIFLFVGFAAGFLNVYRAQMGEDFKIGFRDNKDKTTKDN